MMHGSVPRPASSLQPAAASCSRTLRGLVGFFSGGGASLCCSMASARCRQGDGWVAGCHGVSARAPAIEAGRRRRCSYRHPWQLRPALWRRKRFCFLQMACTACYLFDQLHAVAGESRDVRRQRLPRRGHLALLSARAASQLLRFVSSVLNILWAPRRGRHVGQGSATEHPPFRKPRQQGCKAKLKMC